MRPTSSKETKKSVIGKLRVDEMRKLAQSYGIFLPRQLLKKELESLLQKKLENMSVREVKGKLQRVKSEAELPIESRELRKVIARLRAKLAACESENKLLTEMVGKRARTIERFSKRLKQLEAQRPTKKESKETASVDQSRSIGHSVTV